jgi:hypothetical protein
MSWMSKNTGRPKEEGGHIPFKISLCMSIYAYFQMLKGKGVNISKKIEKLVREDAHSKTKEKSPIFIYESEFSKIVFSIANLRLKEIKDIPLHLYSRRE